MLVDLIELRERGVKLPRHVVLAKLPIRGELSLDEGQPGWYHGKKEAPLLAGLLVPGTVGWALAPLDHAHVSKIRRGNVLICGKQQYSGSGRDKDLQVFPQAWWCRIVGYPTSHTAAGASRRELAGVY